MVYSISQIEKSLKIKQCLVVSGILHIGVIKFLWVKYRGRYGLGYKLGNIVLLAPDIDGNFMRQQVVGKNVQDMPELFTIYSAPKDRLWHCHNYLELAWIGLEL